MSLYFTPCDSRAGNPVTISTSTDEAVEGIQQLAGSYDSAADTYDLTSWNPETSSPGKAEAARSRGIKAPAPCPPCGDPPAPG